MRRIRHDLLLLPLLGVLMAAEPKGEVSAAEHLHAGNKAVERRDFEAAERHYDDAEDSARDPGQVAFNKANALFHRERFLEAERHYTRALDDADATPSRRAAALYNRGVCQLQQGGLTKLRAAVDSFSRCLALRPDDSNLVGDAKHNLELAKLLWVTARAKEQQQPKASDPSTEPPPEPKPERPTQQPYDPFSTEQNPEDGGLKPVGKPQPLHGAAGGTPRTTDEKMADKGNATVIGTADQLPDLNERQVRNYLEQLAVRVAKDRRDTSALTAPPERPAVKDW